MAEQIPTMISASEASSVAAGPYPILKIEGPPGSGKTRELAREVCRLIVQDGLRPEQMLALCITPLNKRRIRHYLTDEAKRAGLGNVGIEILTFEEWFLQILATHTPANQSKPQLLSEPDARVLLQEILRQSVPEGHPLYYASRQPSAARVFFELIRQLQLKGLTPEQVSHLCAKHPLPDSRLPLVAEVYACFQERTRAAHLLCHADLTRSVMASLTASPEVLAVVAAPLKVVLADEAQELSDAHHSILAMLPVQLLLAGNERLSIRSFRAAQPQAFSTLEGYGSRPVAFLAKQACMRGNEAVLSLLNHFLPQPIWETQAPELSQLQEMVHFGFYADPEQEAAGTASLIANFVKNATVNERPARWDDCVVLLRSSHYRSHLFHAFQQQGIPFRCDVLSDSLIHLQHVLFDLFNVVADWQALALDSDTLLDGELLTRHLEALPMSLLEQASLLQKNNRHLLRWLESTLSDSESAAELRHLQASPGDDNSVNPILMELAVATQVAPAVRQAYQRLVSLYVTYREQGSLLELLKAFYQAASSLLNDNNEPISLPDGEATSLPAEYAMFKENLERLDAHYLATFQQHLPVQEALSSYPALWDGAESILNGESAADGAVRLLSIHQVQGEEYPLVVIPFLVSEEFPHTREIPELLSKDEQELLGVELAYRIDETEEARLLAVGMTRATQQLALTCHRLDSGTPVLPSAFYRKLLGEKRLMLQQERLTRICRCETELVSEAVGCEVDFCTIKPLGISLNVQDTLDEMAEALPTDDLYTRYTGESKWAQLEKALPVPVFEPGKVLDMSASSIKTYMKCPRQFYYKHLLRLPQPGNDAASLGTLIHRVMEVFNLGAGKLPYTVQRLKALAEMLFLFQDEPELFFGAGFTEKDQLQMRRLSPLTLSSMKQRLLESIDDLNEKGYFDRYGTLKRIEPEKRLDGVMIDGIEGCRFSGSMDAVIQLSDGSWEIVDYKTFRSAYKAKLDACDKHFMETLEPLPEGDDLSHAERFNDKLRADYPKDYQLPLYYLAGQQNPVYENRLNAVALQIIRPPFADKPEQGSIRLEIPGAEIEAKKAQMIEDINRYIVAPIRQSTMFAASPGRASCGSCGYFGICDAAEDPDAEEGGQE